MKKGFRDNNNLLTLIDAHVHVHAAGEAPGLLRAAAANFARAAQRLQSPDWTGVLLLAEMKQAAWFEQMAAGGQELDGWSVQPDRDDELVLRARNREHELLVMAGRQVATREGIEVLTLATRARCPDGLTLEETLHRSHQANALSVLPWGAGKWLGRRGELVREALAKQSPPVWAGDSAARPGFWPAEAEFKPALSRGRPLINGTDPLPLAGEVRRAGSFGCWLQEAPPARRPGLWLRERLRSATPADLKPFGMPMRIARFVRSQVALRLRKSASSAAAAPIAGAEDQAPDIETSSASYASRFAGRSGRYLLDVQSQCIAQVLADLPPGRALDVGGGHGQLVGLLRSLGWDVTVHGTDRRCEQNLRQLHGQRDVPFVQGDLFTLPAPDRGYDLVIAVRLVSHVEDWPRLLAEMCRVASRAVVIDYPTRGGTNSSSGGLFGVKKAMEGNTRTYLSFTHAQLEREFAAQGFGRARRAHQFVLPMAVHRLGHAMAPLRWTESLSRAMGLTAMAGSPVILRVDRT